MEIEFELTDRRWHRRQPQRRAVEATHEHIDIYREALEEFESRHRHLSLGELWSRLIPTRVVPNVQPSTALTSAVQSTASACPVPHQAESSTSTSFSLLPPAAKGSRPARHEEETEEQSDDSDEHEERGAAGPSQGSEPFEERAPRVHVNVEDLPTYEELLRDYDPTTQHLDSFIRRTFDFPALEELILTKCKEHEKFNSDFEFEYIDSFVVRLVRHLTRFRDSDAPDSSTRIRLVDLRDTNLYEENPEVRLMRLLAPHVKFLADPKPLPEETEE